MKKRFLARALSLLLCATMIVGQDVIPAFAASDEVSEIISETTIVSSEEADEVQIALVEDTSKEDTSEDIEDIVDIDEAGETFNDGDFSYEVHDDIYVTITKYLGSATEVTIPKETTTKRVDGDPYIVDKIGNKAFQDNKSITSVSMEDNIIEIGSGAFKGCTALTSVTLSKGLKTMGNSTFNGCSKLTTIEIPKSLEKCDGGANNGPFENSGLTSITFEKGTTLIAPFLLCNCSSISEVIIPDTVTSIGNYAFYGCNNAEFKRVVIPDYVTEIGTGAFEKCANLEEVQLGKSVEVIDERGFDGCVKLSKIELPKNFTKICSSAFRGCTELTKINIPASLTETYISCPYGPFENTGLKEVIFEEGVHTIPNALFARCKSLDEIEIPKTVTHIGNNAFNGCTGLTEIIIPDAVVEIGNDAFYGCNTLQDVVLGKNLTKIGGSAFEDCTLLANVTLPDKLDTLGGEAFSGCDVLEEINIPKSLTRIVSGSVYGPFRNSAVNKVDFDDDITIIIDKLFEGCTKLEEITLPEGTTSIGSYAFYNCSALKSMTLPSEVTTIKTSAFNGCSSMESIALDDNLTELGGSAFAGCSVLKEIDIPDTVKINAVYGTSIFENCSSLERAHIPDSLSVIPASMFRGCEKLSEINLTENLTKINEYAFENCDSLEELDLPVSLTTISKYAFNDCDGLKSVTMSYNLTKLDKGVFKSCDSLATVKIGCSLDTIPTETFDNCPVLDDVIIPYGITTIEKNAFSNCKELVEITIPRTVETIAAQAFSYANKMKVYGVEGTYAETWAEANEAQFVPINKPAEDARLTVDELKIVRGAKKRIAVILTPEDCTDPIRWVSSDDTIATVDNKGMVSAKKAGNVIIKAYVGDKDLVCKVEVVQPVTGISLDKYSLSMEQYDTFQLTATVNPDNAYDKSISWESDNEEVATVDEDGFVTAVAKGTANIIVSALDGSGITKTCKVTVTNDVILCSDWTELESEHPYENDYEMVWVYTNEAAKSLELTFDEETFVEDSFDYIYIYGADRKPVDSTKPSYTGAALAGQTITVPGNTVRIRLKTNTGTTDYGFKVANCEYEEADSHIITATAGEGGSIWPEGEVKVYDLADQRFDITPNKGYELKDIVVDGASVFSEANPVHGEIDNYYFLEVTENHTIDVSFKRIAAEDLCIITATAGEGGKITPSGEVEVKKGDNQKFEFTANEGYEVNEVLVDDVKVDNKDSYEFKEVSADHKISVSFKKIEVKKCVVTLDPDGGKVEPASVEVIVGKAFGELPKATKDGFTFEGWYDSADKKVEATSIVPDAEKLTLKAKYTQNAPEEQKVVVTFDANGGTVNTVSMNAVVGAKYGTLATATRAGYDFVGWFTDKAAGTEVTADTVVAATTDHTLYAHWNLKKMALVKQKQDITSLFTVNNADGYLISDKDDKKVASVTKKGILYGKKAGTVKVTAYETVKENGKKIKKELETVEIEIIAVTFSDKVVNATVGDEPIDVKKMISDYETVIAGQDSVSFKSSKKKVASIDNDGILTINAKGKTKISVTFEKAGKKVTYSFTVKVKKA